MQVRDGWRGVLAMAAFWALGEVFQRLFSAEERANRRGLLAARSEVPLADLLRDLAVTTAAPADRLAGAMAFVASCLWVSAERLRLDDRLADLAGHDGWIVSPRSEWPVATDTGRLLRAVSQCACRSADQAAAAGITADMTIGDIVALLATSDDEAGTRPMGSTGTQPVD